MFTSRDLPSRFMIAIEKHHHLIGQETSEESFFHSSILHPSLDSLMQVYEPIGIYTVEYKRPEMQHSTPPAVRRRQSLVESRIAVNMKLIGWV
jgi:hypothetical protein